MFTMFSYIYISLLFRKVSLFETEFDLTEFIHGTCRCLIKVTQIYSCDNIILAFFIYQYCAEKRKKSAQKV